MHASHLPLFCAQHSHAHFCNHLCAGVSPDAAHCVQADLPAVQPSLGPGAAVSCLWRLQGCPAEADQLQANHQPLPAPATGQI